MGHITKPPPPSIDVCGWSDGENSRGGGRLEVNDVMGGGKTKWWWEINKN